MPRRDLEFRVPGLVFMVLRSRGSGFRVMYQKFGIQGLEVYGLVSGRVHKRLRIQSF